MRALVILTQCLFSFAFVPQDDIKLEVGAKLNRKYLPKKVNVYIATHPSNFRPYIRRKIAGVEYLIAYDEKSRRITYIHTSDTKFHTAGGLKVGSQISLTRDQLIVYPSSSANYSRWVASGSRS